VNNIMITLNAVRIIPLGLSHWDAVEAIYREGIDTGHVTFESDIPTREEFFATRLPDHMFVAESGGTVLGWVAVVPVSPSPVCAGVVEHSIFVAEAFREQGLGHQLMDALIASTERAHIWTLQSSVFRENVGSLALHASHGFVKVGVRERIGMMTYGPKMGQWRDTLLIERRSELVG
jgi:L-amino acid N-acyltransferase YncA